MEFRVLGATGKKVFESSVKVAQRLCDDGAVRALDPRPFRVALQFGDCLAAIIRGYRSIEIAVAKRAQIKRLIVGPASYVEIGFNLLTYQ